MSKLLLLPGDHIGQEIMREVVRVIDWLTANKHLAVQYESGLLGGAAIDEYGEPFPSATREQARAADAILLGAVGGPEWDNVAPEKRPEKGLLQIRSELGLFANLRPAMLFPQLAGASSLKPELVAGLDLLIVRELTGGIYFGEPRGQRQLASGEREAFNTYVYSESEIERIARVAFEAARVRGGRLCSVDKANVLEATMLWRELVTALHSQYPDVELSHMYVDNAAMQLVREPKQFDVIVTGNMFGDILSDAAAMLTGSIGMLPSASLDANNKGLYEPVHGSAPDISGQDRANPLAMVLSFAMLCRYSLGEVDCANRIEAAVAQVLDQGLRTGDIAAVSEKVVGTRAMGDALLVALASEYST